MNAVRQFEQLSADDGAQAGGKGANLGELVTAGLPVPPGFVIATAAYDAFVDETGIRDGVLQAAWRRAIDTTSAAVAEATIGALFAGADIPSDLGTQIVDAYTTLSATGPASVAVRSSATAEDLAGASFAGQQDTYLNITGPDAVLSAVRDCWASLWTARAMAYRIREGIDPADVSLAVVVQHLVDADAAGVMFTANPANGRRDQIVIAAAWGLGESVVGGTVTTDNLIVRRPHFGPLEVIDRDIADKKVQTVRTETGTEEIEVPAGLRTAAVLTDAETCALAGLGVRIDEHYHVPMDIEWARADNQFYLLQARPVTALPEPIGDAPTDWGVQDKTDTYFRGSIIELLPDPLTPLFGDMIGTAVVGSVTKLLSSLLGALLRPGELTFPLINGYAYYAYKRSALLRMSAVAPFVMPRMFSRRDGNAEHQWRDTYRPRYQQIVARWAGWPAPDLSAGRLLDSIAELLAAAAEYYTSVQMIIPVAATTELTFASIDAKSLQHADDPQAMTFILGLDSLPMRAERDLYDLAVWCRDQPGLVQAIAEVEHPEELAFGERPVTMAGDEPVWSQWQRQLGDHLSRFGHTVYVLDFANPVPADSPRSGAGCLALLRPWRRAGSADPPATSGSGAQTGHQGPVGAARPGPGKADRWAAAPGPAVRADPRGCPGRHWAGLADSAAQPA